LPVPEGGLSAPERLKPTHDLSQFACGKEPLDDWLRNRAAKADGPSARTYVVACGPLVVGYYSLANGSTGHASLNAKLRRNMPDPVPMMVLGRLAVDRRYQGKGLGSGLLKDAMLRTVQANKIAGFRALMVHAIDDDALAFYLSYGFKEYPHGTKTLFLPIETILAGL
jgi:GNAT superfamily N-acetyltransferase